MASVSGVSSSSSIYGNRNIITGLASGLDTETMIENAIKAYQSKISALQQKRTKTEWKQDAYRSMIEKMSAFSDKYASYRSSNNLMSASFFNSAVKTAAKGTNASKVTATGRSSSDIQLNQVKQLATAASYKISGSLLDKQTGGLNQTPAMEGDVFSLAGDRPLSTLTGSMTLTYGGSSSQSKLTIEFDEDTLFRTEDNNVDVEKLVEHINNQLKSQSVTIGSTSYTGDDLLNKVVKAEYDKESGRITFTDPKKNGVYISNATSDVKEHLFDDKDIEFSAEKGEQVTSIGTKKLSALWERKSNIDYLGGNSMTITLDGQSKTVKTPTAAEILAFVDWNKVDGGRFGDKGKALADSIRNGEELSTAEERNLRDNAYIKALQDSIDSKFGAGKVKVTDALADTDAADGAEAKSGIKLKFEASQAGSTLSITAQKGKAMGMGENNNLSSYLNTSMTLGDILSEEALKKLEKAEGVKVPQRNEDGTIKHWLNGAVAYEEDEDGNPIYESDANGNTLLSFKVNGVEIGKFSKDSTLQEVMDALNSNSESDVKVSYSKMTNELVFNAKEAGANSKIEFSGLSAALFSDNVGKISSNFNDAYGLYLNEGDTDKLNIHAGNQIFGISGITNKTTTKEIVDKFNNDFKSTGYVAAVNEFTGEFELRNKDGGGKADFWMDTERVPGEQWKLKAPEVKASYTIGQDSVMDVTINGTKIENLTRSSNTVDLDGLSVTLKGTFETKADEEPVTFETTADADKLVNVIKQMVSDYNTMVTEIKDAYSKLPAQRSNKKYYEPLTEEEMEGMSESAIEKWQEKAKQGVLFGDRDLANLYQRLTSAISMTGEYGATLRSAGITVNYASGLSTLEFNEDAFRAALEKDPDAVRDAFTGSVENGASQNGLMQALKIPLDMYGKTSGGKGILVEKAGSPLAASTMYSNFIQTELNNIDTQIEKWQDKMSNQIDYYTNQFSKLEQLIQQMNSQSSYFAQLTGGGY